jgi:hypothetical protein
VAALERLYPHLSGSLIAADDDGVWGHPKLSVEFARWLSPTFDVWCDAAITDILSGSAVRVYSNPA